MAASQHNANISSRIDHLKVDQPFLFTIFIQYHKYFLHLKSEKEGAKNDSKIA